MNEKELRAKVAHIQIVVKRLMNTDLSGDFTSAFKGGGLEFAQLRSYVPGDEVRSIDWKSSAKMNKLMVKEFVQEKERTVLIALDTSSSLVYSSQSLLKQAYACNIAASLALIAQHSNDRVGLLLFSDTVQQFIPPRKGKGHGAHVVRHIFTTGDEQRLETKTDMRVALERIASLSSRNVILFIISDWITPDTSYIRFLPVVGTRYDAVAVRIIDPREVHLPDIGVLHTLDPETGETVMLDTRGAAGRELNAALQHRLYEQKMLLKKHKIDVLDVDVERSFIDAMTSFFHYRVH